LQIEISAIFFNYKVVVMNKISFLVLVADSLL
jgi:hypothetical protein